MTQIFFNSHDIQIYRHRRIGSTNRYGVSATLTVYPADIQPAGIERQEMVGGRFGSVYETYMDASIDIKEGDQVVDTATDKRYSVKGITEWDGAGLLDHKQIILVSMDGSND